MAPPPDAVMTLAFVLGSPGPEPLSDNTLDALLPLARASLVTELEERASGPQASMTPQQADEFWAWYEVEYGDA
ncbi:hypothetical protein Q5752_004338 [Cryptotrichosporon argae]